MNTSSSHLSKSSEISFENLSFIMEEIELDCYNTYNLMDLAGHYNVDVTGLDDNKAAKEVVQELVSRNFEKQKVDQMKVENEVFYVFNKKRADELPPLYLTKKSY